MNEQAEKQESDESFQALLGLETVQAKSTKNVFNYKFLTKSTLRLNVVGKVPKLQLAKKETKKEESSVSLSEEDPQKPKSEKSEKKSSESSVSRSSISSVSRSSSS
jgi:hypothetical protein